MALGTSIRLFLADGSADGLWVVEKSNWTGLALMAPRTRYPALRKRPEMTGPGVYVLIGPSESAAKTARVYVGETDVLKDRLDQHYKNRDYWTRVVVFTAKDANLNKAHVRYLESRLLGLATEAGRAEVDNSTGSTLPALSEADTADIEAFLADMLLIYPVLGVQAFERPDDIDTDQPERRLYLNGKDTRAEGRETSDGFVVYAGSLGRAETVPSLHQYTVDLRQQLVAAGTLVREGLNLRLVNDYVFASPSTAAAVLLGRTSNGRVEWKAADGTTLKEIQARAVEI